MAEQEELVGTSLASFEEAVTNAMGMQPGQNVPIRYEVELFVEHGGFVGGPQFIAHLSEVQSDPAGGGDTGDLAEVSAD